MRDSEKKRIELKWQCVRRSNEYKKDYAYQERYWDEIYGKHSEDFPDEFGEMFENTMFGKWFIRTPLPDPKHELSYFKKKLGKRYNQWFLKTFRCMIEKDPLAAKPVELKNLNLEKIAFPEKYWARISSKEFRKKDYYEKVLAKLNHKNIESDLSHCSVTFDAFTPIEELSESFRKLVQSIKKKANLKKKTAYRNSDLQFYLQEYDKPKRKRKSTLRGQLNENIARTARRHRQKAETLINKRGWRLI